MAKQQNDEARIKNMIEGVQSCDTQAARQLAQNIIFMESKLDAAREEIGNASLVIEYDNGGGQTGETRNPLIASYESLVKTYAATIRQLETMKSDETTDSIFDWNK